MSQQASKEKPSGYDKFINWKLFSIPLALLIQTVVGIGLFVVFCFMTEAIPLPMVAFCIGVLALMTGIVDRSNVASL